MWNEFTAVVVPTTGFARAFVSHDEYVEFASDENNGNLVTGFAAQLLAGPPPGERAFRPLSGSQTVGGLY